MDANRILADQVVYVKRGRLNGLGFEPCFNSYFDFYLDSRYFGVPLLSLEDVTFHLYLRKNLNDQNPKWRMPTMRQMKKKFSMGHPRINSIIDRLEAAHLLKRESGVRVGQPNITNAYVLSDPISTLQEFIAVASEGVFGHELLPEWCARIEHTEDEHVLESSTPDVPNTDTHKQTLLKQTWNNILSGLKITMLASTFNAFLADTTLDLDGNTAIIRTPNTFAHDWIESRMKEKLLKMLNCEPISEGVVLTDLKCIN